MFTGGGGLLGNQATYCLFSVAFYLFQQWQHWDETAGSINFTQRWAACAVGHRPERRTNRMKTGRGKKKKKRRKGWTCWCYTTYIFYSLVLPMVWVSGVETSIITWGLSLNLSLALRMKPLQPEYCIWILAYPFTSLGTHMHTLTQIQTIASGTLKSKR